MVNLVGRQTDKDYHGIETGKLVFFIENVFFCVGESAEYGFILC